MGRVDVGCATKAEINSAYAAKSGARTGGVISERLQRAKGLL